MMIDKTLIRNSYREQAALAQLHRWIAYNLDEHAPRSRVDDLLGGNSELFVDGASVATGFESIANYRDANPVATIISQDVEVIGDLDGDFKMRAKGRELGERGQYQSVEFSFDWQDRLQPLLQSISYAVLEGEKPKIEPVEPIASRLMSVSNRWHVLVEDPERSPEPFQEIISDNFVMDYGHGTVRSYEELVDWVNGSASSVGASRHDLVGLTCKTLEPDLYRAVFVLDWNGLTHEDKHMTAKTKHIWTIRDISASRFPVIEHINVEFLQTFKVME